MSAPSAFFILKIHTLMTQYTASLDAAVQAALEKLEDDSSLAYRTTTPAQITDLLYFVLRFR